MPDGDVQNHIEELVSEEQRLREEGANGLGLDDAQRERLEQIRVQLDRYWDLLRQRRAHEEFGLDPDQTSLRTEDTVEGYEQ